MAEQLTPTSAAEFRRGSTFIVKISERLTIELKRPDMLTMVMNDSMPLPLLDAAMNFERHLAELDEQRKQEGQPPLSEVERYAKIPPETLTGMLAMLRQYAIIHAVNPRIIPPESRDTDGIPVNMLTPHELLGIFYAVPEGEVKEEPPVTKDEAIEFRRESADVPSDAGQSSTEVRPTAKLLDLPKREAISA